MIVSRDIHPKRDFYYLGAKIIDVLSNQDHKVIDFFDLFHEINISEKISISLYVLTLDWLYLIGAIDKFDKRKITRCF